jgi:hypothetical protein
MGGSIESGFAAAELDQDFGADRKACGSSGAHDPRFAVKRAGLTGRARLTGRGWFLRVDRPEWRAC